MAFMAYSGMEMANDKPIYVTQPFLPPLEEFVPYLEQIWESRSLTNGGPFHQKLESALADYFGVKHLALVSNGTVGLMVALQALNISGEVITTPYSFVATAHSLLWTNLKPVFVDIDSATCNLDPSKIEAAITPQTSAILPVHCYGTPCDVEGIQRIADKHKLKVLYDAAHAFAVKHKDASVLGYGDLSVLSFHATKVFNTFEGGAIICPDSQTKQKIDHLKNFGLIDETTVTMLGTNGKMNEFQSALGLLQLKHIDAMIEARRNIAQVYLRDLRDVRGISCLLAPTNMASNYSYFPILVGPDYSLSRDGLYQRLRDHGVFSRRYFYPLISEMPMYRDLPSAAPANLPVATRVAQQVLCLPIYPALKAEQLETIVELIAAQ